MTGITWKQWAALIGVALIAGCVVLSSAESKRDEADRLPSYVDESSLGAERGDCRLLIPNPVFVELSEYEFVKHLEADGCDEAQIESQRLRFTDNQATAEAHLDSVATEDATWEAWTADSLSRCDEYERTKRMECEQHREAKVSIAFLTLQELPLEQRAEWRVHEQRMERINEEVQGMSTSREAVPVNCANAPLWQADTREALEFIQGLGNERLLGKEAQLVMLTRAHDALVESCVEMGQ